MVCNKCNSDLIWQSDFNADEYGFENLDDGIVTVYYCPKCDEIKEFLMTEKEIYQIIYDVEGDIILLK